MTLSAVAKRYADAFADVVTASGSPLPPEKAVAELRSFEDTLRASHELHEALLTPAVPAGRKRAVVGRIAGLLKLSSITRNVLYVLIDRRRIALLHDIIQQFERAVDERLGFARADVISARELTAPQRTALDARLTQLTGKSIRMHFTVDESLIGGVIARIGSSVYDGSVRGQLETLGRRLAT